MKKGIQIESKFELTPQHWDATKQSDMQFLCSNVNKLCCRSVMQQEVRHSSGGSKTVIDNAGKSGGYSRTERKRKEKTKYPISSRHKKNRTWSSKPAACNRSSRSPPESRASSRMSSSSTVRLVVERALLVAVQCSPTPFPRPPPHQQQEADHRAHVPVGPERFQPSATLAGL